jgi:hypothetical protein
MAGIMMPDEREYVRRVIAGCIDYPSVYMGGPSQNSLRIAGRIMDALDRGGRLQPASCDHGEWSSSREHGTHCPTCGMQCHEVQPEKP